MLQKVANERNVFRKGIARKLVERALDLAKNSDCQWVGASATAVASQTLFQKVTKLPAN